MKKILKTTLHTGKTRQLSFFKNKNSFGGSLLIGHRKIQRPLSTKSAIHLILKSQHKGIFNPSNQSLLRLIRSQAEKFNIRLYEVAVNWSHIHMVIKIKSREDYLKFIRALTSLIAMRAQKAQKVFTLRPFTRLVAWGKDFENIIQYQILNQLEANGLISRSKKPYKLKS